MNNVIQMRRICLQRRRLILSRSIQSNGIRSIHTIVNTKESVDGINGKGTSTGTGSNGRIQSTSSSTSSPLHVGRTLSTTKLGPSHAFHQAKLFSSMPVGESRAKARDDHIKEEIFENRTVDASMASYAQDGSTHANTVTADPDQNEAATSVPKNNDADGGRAKSESDKDATPKRRRLSEVPISEVLKSKHTLRWVEPTIHRNSTVRNAITTCIDRRLSGMMVIENNSESSSSMKNSSAVSIQRGKVVGLATPRDLLRIISSGFEDGETDEDIFQRKVGDYMTPITQVIYARPEETIGTCRSIMAKLGVKCLPILSNGRVEGLITARDMAEFGLEAAEKGGKKHYLENKSVRVGLSSDTSMAEPPSYIKAHLALKHDPLYTNIGLAELPHPFKTPESCGMNRRDYGPNETANDCDLSEDANFIQQQSDGLIYAGVADGVGSWREYGVDPREFSHALMQECDSILKETKTEVNGSSVNSIDDEMSRKTLTPMDVMSKALKKVVNDNIIGSSTACIAMFDGMRHQLHFSNLGDSGIVVLRHIDVDVAGTGAVKREKKRTSDLKVAFVSQQQLRSFNHPFQLGWTGEDTSGEDTSFKTAEESCTNSIHIRRGDIIIMATDGLFDNVELEDIAKLALEWEQKNGFITDGDIVSREKRWRKGNSMTAKSAETIDELAKTLVDRARENSLDSSTDSPFAILAKENDIMWSGGMPDDCTVVAMHIVGQSATAEEEDN